MTYQIQRPQADMSNCYLGCVSAHSERRRCVGAHLTGGMPDLDPEPLSGQRETVNSAYAVPSRAEEVTRLRVGPNSILDRGLVTSGHAFHGCRFQYGLRPKDKSEGPCEPVRAASVGESGKPLPPAGPRTKVLTSLKKAEGKARISMRQRSERCKVELRCAYRSRSVE